MEEGMRKAKTWRCMLLWFVYRMLKEVDLIGIYVSWQSVTGDKERMCVYGLSYDAEEPRLSLAFFIYQQSLTF